jgi:hypothetical protein
MLQQLANQESENQGAVCNISLAEAGFGLQFNCWQFNVRVVIFEIELKREKRRTNVWLWAASARQ